MRSAVRRRFQLQTPGMINAWDHPVLHRGGAWVPAPRACWPCRSVGDGRQRMMYLCTHVEGRTSLVGSWTGLGRVEVRGGATESRIGPHLLWPRCSDHHGKVVDLS